MERIKKDDARKSKLLTNTKSIEEKIEEAEKAFKENRVFSENQVWENLSVKYGFDL